MKMKRLSTYLIFVFTAIAVFSVSCFAANEITSVGISRAKNKIEISATLTDAYLKDNRGKEIYFFALAPYQSVSSLSSSASAPTPLGSVRAAANMTFSVDFDKNDRAMLFAKIIMTELSTDGVYTVLGGARYIENVSELAVESYDYPSFTSKKGLQAQLISDAQELGIAHTVINIPINEYILVGKNTTSISFLYDNVSYYVNGERLASLDHKVKVFTEAGIHVYFNIILTPPGSDLPEELKCLYYTDKTESASLYAFNTKNESCVKYLEAILTFFAKRYTAQDKEHGFAGSYILGYEVNSNGHWNYMGDASIDEYLNLYTVAFRIADTALRSVYSNGRVFISVANNFTSPTPDISDEGNDKLFYPGRELLLKFAQKLRYAGDIPWHLSINAYPSDLHTTDITKDSLATDSPDTKFITVLNIDVLCDFMGQSELLYNGARRSIMVGEFGVSAEPGTAGESLQAAAYAYAYYKLDKNPYIESFIYHRHVDHSGEGGLWFGLYTRADGSTVSPASKKTIYSVFKDIDTDKSLTQTAFAPALLGAASWSALIPDFSENQTKRTIIEAIPIAKVDVEKKFSDVVLHDFTTGNLYDFYPSETAGYIELRADTTDTAVKSKLYASLVSFTGTAEYMGIAKYYTVPLDMSQTGYLSVKLKAEVPSEVAVVSVMLRLLDKKSNTLYEGIAQVKPNEWEEITFDMKDYIAKTQSCDSLKIWLLPADGKIGGGNYGIWLENITAHAKKSHSVIITVICIIIYTVIGIIAIFALLVLRKQLIIRKRRRAYLAKQQRRQGK